MEFVENSKNAMDLKEKSIDDNRKQSSPDELATVSLAVDKENESKLS